MSEGNNASERKLAPGLFQEFALGSKLVQGPIGNEISNLKSSPFNYEDAYKNSTNNVKVSAEDMKKLSEESVTKAQSAFDKLKNKLAHKKNPPNDPAAVAAKIGREKLGQKEMTRRAVEGKKEHAKKSENADEMFTSVPEDMRSQVLAEMDRRADEARKSNDQATVEKIEKAKDKAKKCWGPGMDQKEAKSY